MMITTTILLQYPTNNSITNTITTITLLLPSCPTMFKS